MSTRRSFSSSTAARTLNINNINPHVKEAKYAVRGELAIKSEQYRTQLAKGEGSSLPFDSVISANIGNPQQLDQKPITFFRQVASLVENPLLLEHGDVLQKSLGYKSDAIDRAKKLLKDVKSVGAYSQSQGAPGIRKSVADFIERRDGYSADPDNIYLCAGASAGVNALMNVMLDGPKTGVLVPIPQYPLYTATLSLLDGQAVPYYLNEESQWSTDVDGMRSALKEARKNGIDVRAVVVINPGNPTGGSLDADNIKSVLQLAADEKLVVLADEVYQTNVFEGEFTSFKKCLRELQESKLNENAKFDCLELASLHSVSKGMVGECGHRGGYYEMVGFDPEVVAQIYKFVSIMLCPPVVGQCIVEMMVNPPKEGEPSYDLYRHEYDAIYNNLYERAQALYKAFKEMEGVECQSPQGSMYLYPTINLPQKAHEAAKKAGKNPDDFYCLELLDATGVCIVPGSGFGQREGTLHFRTTFLAPGTDWVSRITAFHSGFMDKYR
ncbi:PLP-dependent transferase [Sphaerulina musiva SO2202]|uniref:Glutamate pyruvate transaminase n=1 Tax=Sphaerulina musiva (strain SO2202) TaxID=692275 RepID=N1QH92_SPHMS|nr:PLP-dependent transferase [Sphaerulina musiva SO2202]EMF16555.1 PLP-dependent transferase [Sphaerulina musiva SO2202]